MFEQRATWVERQIQDAMARGEFDDLPGAGKPIEDIDEPYDEDWWVKRWIKREKLDVSSLLPTELVLKREIEDLRERVDKERREDDVRAVVADLNHRIREARRRPSDGPTVYVRTVDEEAVVAAWRQRRDT